jgi:coenzyme F420-reducing hydrogenase alpha subunit
LNSVVQLVECAHVLEHSLAMLENMMTRPPKEAKMGFKVVAGNGSASVEAPRGILFHRYLFNEDGVCTAANLCIPTNQNHGNLQKDVEALVPSILNLSQTDIQKYLEMLVRAYDPCVSCSTHYLDVKFV